MCTLLLSLIACTKNGEIQSATEEAEPTYVLFSLNVHDWTHPAESVTVVNKVLDMHEQYNIPVEVYLDDQITQIYNKEAPELLERLRTAGPLIVVSYHIRPPTPYYQEFDFDYLEELDEETLREVLLDYEEHSLDLETGQPTDEPGGYEFVKEIMGYPPLTVAGFIKTTNTGEMLVEIYTKKGAQFIVQHSGSSSLGEKIGELYIRPETTEIKLYESIGQDAATVISDKEQSIATTRDKKFIGIKMHEDDFYAEGVSPWRYVYYNENNQHPDKPPYNLTGWQDAPLLTAEQQEAMWQHYETALAFIAEHPERFEALNTLGVKELL